MSFPEPYGPQSRIIDSQSREMIYNVYIYFLNESKQFKHLELGYFSRVRDRVATATGVSKSFVYKFISRIKKEGSVAFATPPLGRPKKPSTAVAETDTMWKMDANINKNPHSRPTSQEQQPAPKKPKLEIVSIKVENETDSDDSDSNSTENGSLANKAAERDSPPRLVKVLPQIVNTVPTVSSQTNTARPISTGPVTNSTTMSKLPSLTKCSQNNQPIFTNSIPQIFYTDSAVLSQVLPSLVSCVPISLNLETVTTNSPALTKAENMMDMNTNNVGNSSSDRKSRGIVMSPMSMFVETPARNGTNILITPDINLSGSELSVAETDLKIVKVESLAVDDDHTGT